MTDIKSCLVVDIGTVDLPISDALLEKLVLLRRNDQAPDMVVLSNYEKCLAFGARKFDPRDLLQPLNVFAEQDIPLYQSVRGGGLTYYWPGQIIFYPILKLDPEEQNIPQYMHKLEQVALQALAETDIHAKRLREDTAQIGLWVKSEKIVSMGIRISQWVTSYGFALNAEGNLGPSRWIKPCGLDVRLTSVEEQLGQRIPKEHLMRLLLLQFEKIFQRTLSPIIKIKADEVLEQVLQSQQHLPNSILKEESRWN